MKFIYRIPDPSDQTARDDPYHRMVAEGTLACAMSAFAAPTLEDWRRISDPAHCWMLRCEDAETRDLLGVGLFTPWRWRVWEFDFTAFRPAFAHGVAMARGGFQWMFDHAPCDSIFGLCPVPNRHAWRLAEAAGFTVLGRIEGACKWARTDSIVPGVMVVVTRDTLNNGSESR